jgi:hypothetical protein
VIISRISTESFGIFDLVINSSKFSFLVYNFSMYNLIIKFHVGISILFLLVAFIRLFRSIRGWRRHREYVRLDHYLGFLFLILLYGEFLTGLFLYFFYSSKKLNESLSVSEAIENMEMRFWAIEHFALMTFALILTQIGHVLINKSFYSRSKHRYTTYYVATCIILICISVGIVII